MCACVCAELLQSCPTLCNPMNYSLPGCSVHGILQARVLEWVAMPSSRGSSQPRDQTQVSCIAGRFFTIWATREAQSKRILIVKYFKCNAHSKGRIFKVKICLKITVQGCWETPGGSCDVGWAQGLTGYRCLGKSPERGHSGKVWKVTTSRER